MTAPEIPQSRVIHDGTPPVDPGNDLLAIVPAKLTTSVQETSAGQRLAATVRTVDTTLTVFLAADDVDTWVEALRTSRARMSGLIIPGGSL